MPVVPTGILRCYDVLPRCFDGIARLAAARVAYRLTTTTSYFIVARTRVHNGIKPKA